MNPEADREFMYDRQVLGLLSAQNQLVKGIYMSMEITYDKMAKDMLPPSAIPAKKTLSKKIAPRNDTGKCGYSEWCIECYENTWSNDPQDKFYNCKNKDKEFQWGEGEAECRGRTPNLCGSGDQPCMWSWKYGARHACRNPAEAYMVQLPHPTASYNASNVDYTNNRGVCNVQNCDGVCVESWINNGHIPYRSRNFRCLVGGL